MSVAERLGLIAVALGLLLVLVGLWTQRREHRASCGADRLGWPCVLRGPHPLHIYSRRAGRRVRDGVAWRVSRSTGLPCHAAAPRGSTTGAQGRARLESTAVPYALAEAVTIAAERDLVGGEERWQSEPTQTTLLLTSGVDEGKGRS